MEHLEAYNKKLLANILPVHVAEHFLNSDNNDVTVLVPVVKKHITSKFFSGAVSRAVRIRVHHVRVHSELLGVLRGAREQQRRSGMLEAAQRDNSRF